MDVLSWTDSQTVGREAETREIKKAEGVSCALLAARARLQHASVSSVRSMAAHRFLHYILHYTQLGKPFMDERQRGRRSLARQCTLVAASGMRPAQRPVQFPPRGLSALGRLDPESAGVRYASGRWGIGPWLSDSGASQTAGVAAPGPREQVQLCTSTLCCLSASTDGSAMDLCNRATCLSRGEMSWPS